MLDASVALLRSAPIPARLLLAPDQKQVEALPKEKFGSASSIQTCFRKWEKAGVFDKIWKAGLAEYDEPEGIAWEWQSTAAMVKAPLAKDAVRPNPMGRGLSEG